MCLGYLIVTLTVIALSSSMNYSKMEEFFPQIKGDLTKVTWAHAVNSIEKFNQAVKDGVMMFEADVLLGTLEGSVIEEKIPIMSHPPKQVSDLSLENFLTKASELKNVGIKLDFKSLEAVDISLQILKAKEHLLNFPVWLNADILPGPVHSVGDPVNADFFLSKCKEMFPQSTLSLGWKVRFGEGIPLGKYEDQHIRAMKTVILRNGITQPITFAVEAGIASRSLDTLPEVFSIPNIDMTMTLWGGNNVIDFDKLRELVALIGKNRTYLDLPIDVIEKLNVLQMSSKHSLSEGKNILGNFKVLCAIVVISLALLYKAL